jgi:hypothetical protein
MLRTAVPIEAPTCWMMLTVVVPRATLSLRSVCMAPVTVGIIGAPMPKPPATRQCAQATGTAS